MATGIVQMGILGDATYRKEALEDENVFTGKIYMTRIGPFVQISGVGIQLKANLAANSRVYSASLIPFGCRANRDFPINTLVNQRGTLGGVYVNSSGTVFFMSPTSAGYSTGDKFNFSGVYIVADYGASDS